MSLRFRVMVQDQHGNMLRNDERIVATNAKPEAEWELMVLAAAQAIFISWQSCTDLHPFDGEWRVLLSRAEVEVEGIRDSSGAPTWERNAQA